MNAQGCLAGEEIAPAELESLLDALAEGVLILAPECRVVFINDAACAILGVDRGEAKQLGWEGLRKRQSAINLSALPARLEELCKFGAVEVELPGDITDKKVVCRVRPICPPGGQPRLVALVLSQTQQVRLPSREQQAAGPTGQLIASGPDAQQPLGPGTSALREASPHGQRELLCRTLEATGWNVAKAARRLKVSRTTLYARIARYGLSRPKD